MTERTAASFGDKNHGLQVGQNSGPIHAAFHLPPGRPETPPKPSFNVPFRRDPDFVERNAILDRIHETCLQPASRVALVGLGGVGKSQLAIEYAYRARDEAVRENREVWVFWVYAETRARVEEGFKSIADAAKIPGRNQAKNIPQLVYHWLQNERNGRWLMILDSADNLDVFYNTQAMARQTASEEEKRPLSAYLPQSSNGSILVTTRDRYLAYRLTGSYTNINEVGPMDQEHALTLLARKLKVADMNTATKLVEALEYIPLAISQAAAYIQRKAPRISISKYLEEFQKGEEKKSGLLSQDSGDLRRNESAKNSVITTWQISFDHIRLRRPSATDLLCLMSFFDRQGIYEWLIRPPNHTQGTGAGIDNDIFEKDIEMLKDYCLVQTNESGDVFEMYKLVQLSVRRWLGADGKSERFKGQFISRIANAFPIGDFKTWDTCQKLFPHVEKAVEYRPNEEGLQKAWALLLYNGSWYARAQRKYTTSEAMAKMSQDMLKTVLGPEHPHTLRSMGSLASTYKLQGRFKEAEFLDVQVMEAWKTALGPDHPHTLASMGNLASTYRNQGRWKEAESLEIRVMETGKMVLGPDHPYMLISMGNLALTYRGQERWEEAESLEAQVVETKKMVLGPDHPSTLSSIANLALGHKGGANSDTTNNSNQTSPSCTVSNKHVTVQPLSAYNNTTKNIDTNPREEYGDAVQVTARNSYQRIIQTLLKNNADLRLHNGYFDDTLQIIMPDGCNWKEFYHLQGWKSLPDKIASAEHDMNDGDRTASVYSQNLQSMGDGHVDGNTGLWLYDPVKKRVEVSWQHLFMMRLMLESNWDRGRYTNFQLPHPAHTEEGHEGAIYCIQYNSKYLVSGGYDGTVRIWNLETRRLAKAPLRGHKGYVTCLQFDMDPEEDLIVSGGYDRDLIIWRFSTGDIWQHLKNVHEDQIWGVKFDKRIIVTCSEDKSIKVFNRMPLRPGDLGYGETDALDPVGVKLKLSIIPPYTMIATLKGHSARVNAVQIHGEEIVSAGDDTHIRLWHWPSQTLTKTFIGHQKSVVCVQYDGRHIVSGSRDNEVKIFDGATGMEVTSLSGHTKLVHTIQAEITDVPCSAKRDPERPYLQSTKEGRRLQELEKSQRPGIIEAGSGGPYGRIVSGSSNGSIILWRPDEHGCWRKAQSFTSSRHLNHLQFTARYLICCRTSNRIVGWDFCDNNPQLEKASMFFGP